MTTTYNRYINLRIDDRLHKDFLNLKTLTHIDNDSQLLRIVMALGIMSTAFLKENGKWDTCKVWNLKRAMSQLSREEKEGLLATLQRELGV